MVTHVFYELFSWPAGIVVGNLIASAIWATPALIHLHRKLSKQHQEHMRAIASVLATKDKFIQERKPPVTSVITKDIHPEDTSLGECPEHPGEYGDH